MDNTMSESNVATKLDVPSVNITLDAETLKIINAAIADTDETVSVFVQELVKKTCEQKKIALALSRLNNGKKFIAQQIVKNVKGFESLEFVYQAAGMSDDVATAGGIKKVYEKLYQASGLNLPAAKIRHNQMVVVPAKA